MINVLLPNRKSVKLHREMWSAYRKATELYTQQQKSALAQSIKQAFKEGLQISP